MRAFIDKYLVNLLMSLCLLFTGGSVAYAMSATKAQAKSDVEIIGLKDRIVGSDTRNEKAHERIEGDLKEVKQDIKEVLKRMGGK